MSAVLIEILSGVQIPAKLSDEQSRIQKIEMLEDGGRLKVPDCTDVEPSSHGVLIGLANKIPDRMKQKFILGPYAVCTVCCPYTAVQSTGTYGIHQSLQRVRSECG
jgi:hypothetical protein